MQFKQSIHMDNTDDVSVKATGFSTFTTVDFEFDGGEVILFFRSAEKAQEFGLAVTHALANIDPQE